MCPGARIGYTNLPGGWLPFGQPARKWREEPVWRFGSGTPARVRKSYCSDFPGRLCGMNLIVLLSGDPAKTVKGRSGTSGSWRSFALPVLLGVAYNALCAGIPYLTVLLVVFVLANKEWWTDDYIEFRLSKGRSVPSYRLTKYYAHKAGLKKPDTCPVCGEAVDLIATRPNLAVPLSQSNVAWMCWTCRGKLQREYNRATRPRKKPGPEPKPRPEDVPVTAAQLRDIINEMMRAPAADDL